MTRCTSILFIMSEKKKTAVRVSPAVFLLLAAFILCSSPLLLAALLLAALAHELGHYFVLRRSNCGVSGVYVTALGAEMRLSHPERLSYGAEMAATAAGPLANILWTVALSWAGHRCEMLYLFSGAQLVLALFNLLPVRPLDGGRLLWLALAWRWEPFTADRVSGSVGLCTSSLLLLGGVWLFRTQGGSPFLLLGALGLLCCTVRSVLPRREKKGSASRSGAGKCARFFPLVKSRRRG